MSTETLPYLLTAYGMPHRMGYLKTLSGEEHPRPLSAIDFMEEAVRLNLAGVEIPVNRNEMLSLSEIKEGLKERNLKIVADTMTVMEADAAEWRVLLEKSAFLGAKVVRTLLSGILCGDRRGFPGGWENHFKQCQIRLKQILPIVSDLGLCIAVENHQDATTEDLLNLHDKLNCHPDFGVVLDTGNPLAVGQDPVQAARDLSPIIRHLHLKDYTIHYAPEGYRLVRCANGSGVIDFEEILSVVSKNGFDLTPGIEIAAQATRTIPVLEKSWWDQLPGREAKEFATALKILWEKGKDRSVPFSSAWERGENSEAVSCEERNLVEDSSAYFHALHRKNP